MSEDYNDSVILVGLPGMGKTTVVRKEILAHLQSGPTAYALVHDVNRQFTDMAVCYENVDEWKKALLAAAAAKKPFPRGASIGGSAEDLTRAAIELGRAHNSAGNVKLKIKLAYDETSLMGTSGSSYMGAVDIELLSNRRHLGIATLHNVQRATSLTEGFYTMATRVYIYAQPSERRTKVLEEYLGLPEGALLELVGAEPFKFKLWRSGHGLVEPGQAAA